MIRYDSNIIYQFARHLELKAKLLFWLATLSFAVIGSLAASVAADQAQFSRAFGWGGFIIGGLIGLLIGSDIAFRIRIALHTMLCQVQIEENTRAAGLAPLDDLDRRLLSR